MSQFLGKHDLQEESEKEDDKKRRVEIRNKSGETRQSKVIGRCRPLVKERVEDFIVSDARYEMLLAHMYKRYYELGLDDPVVRAKLDRNAEEK